MKVSCEEVFGPVVTVSRVADFDEGLRLANDSTYGLQAGVFTGSVAHALQAARTLRFGGVLVNEVPTFRADLQPYGGVKDSGNTREGPKYAIQEMTELRFVSIEA
jgi:acyl-CoA reductase-like NAD-dependent aldehyde dehydrogenase